MVALDHRRGPAPGGNALDHVGIEGALGQEGRALDLRRLAVEDVHEQPADGLALGLRVRDALKLAEEKFTGVNVYERNVVVVAEHGHDLLGLVEPQEPGVHEDAGQLVAYGLVDQDGGDGGVHAAGQAADHPALAHLLADARHRLLAEGGHGPVPGQAGDAVGEVAQDQGAAGRVRHLRVELDAVEPATLVGDHREGAALGGGDHLEARRDGGDLVAMAHPDDLAVADLAQAGQKRRLPLDADLGPAELAVMAALDPPAHLGAEGHLTIADAQDGHAELEDAGGDRRAVVLVHAGRAAGQDHRLRGEGVQHGLDAVVGVDLAIDPALAKPPGDELGHLAAEVDDQDAFMDGGGGHSGVLPSARARTATKNPSVSEDAGVSRR